MFDLYPYLMAVIVIATIIVFAFICYVEVRHKKVLQFNENIRKSLNKNTLETPKQYEVKLTGQNDSDKPYIVKKPNFSALMFSGLKLKFSNFFLRSDCELMFTKNPELEILKRNYDGGYFRDLEEPSRVNSSPHLGHGY